MTTQPPPTQQAIVTDTSGFVALPWLVFFNAMFSGDAGKAWSPIIANMTVSGGQPKITGRVYQLSKYVSFFAATITPPQGANITGVAGTTVITNFPLKMSGNGVCFAVSGLLGATSGMCDQQSNGIYPPAFSSVTVPLTILGIVEAS